MAKQFSFNTDYRYLYFRILWHHVLEYCIANNLKVNNFEKGNEISPSVPAIALLDIKLHYYTLATVTSVKDFHTEIDETLSCNK